MRLIKWRVPHPPSSILTDEVTELSKQAKANYAKNKKKVYDIEKELKEQGYFTIRRGNAHGLFHIVALSPSHVLLVQALRLHKFNYKDINKELVKIQDFVLSEKAPYARCELWVWVNNRGWIKFRFDSLGNFHKYEDFGFHHYRKKNNFYEKR
jgi:hypothetical protein